MLGLQYSTVRLGLEHDRAMLEIEAGEMGDNLPHVSLGHGPLSPADSCWRISHICALLDDEHSEMLGLQ